MWKGLGHVSLAKVTATYPVMEFLDREQGEDPDLLAARERMPEPTQVWSMRPGLGQFCVRLAERIPANFWSMAADDPYLLSPVATAAFMMEWVRTEGAAFLVWRAARDGKIYM